MKKTSLIKYAALLIALCLTCALPGCSSEGREASRTGPDTQQVTPQQMEEKLDMPVVHVVMDLPNVDEGIKAGQLEDTLAALPGYGREFTVLVQTLAKGGAEREAVITSIKTEMMAGKGPDLFLCEQDTYGLCGMAYYGANTGTDPFFPFPERAMENRLFLPLDEYIEKAEYMEWDKLLPVVMEAGRNEEGQQIIPLSFSFEAMYVDMERYGLEDFDRSMTLTEMRQSDNPAIQYAASQRTPDLMGRVTEPGADEPMFTEEELLGYVREYYRLPGEPKDYRELQEDETVYQEAMTRGLLPEPDLISPARDLFVLGEGSPRYRIIPQRNVRGGVTASINEIAAINRNARHPELAFKIIDYLMSMRVQQDSSFFHARVPLGMPVHMDLGSGEHPLKDRRWHMSEENFQEYCAARDEITEAKFPGPADKALWDIDTLDPGNLEKSVHEQYTLMEMLLAES